MKTSFLLIILPFLIISCGKNINKEFDPIEMNEISGEKLWKRITSDQDYKKYKFWNEHEGINPGQSPHGLFHRVYINKTINDSLPVKKGAELPVGSIVVKENMDEESKTGSLTVMAKVEGYDAENNDWFWAKYSPEGDVLAEGSPKGCISCHSGMKKNDYIIIMQIDK